jgi:hypothetical protein
MDVDQCFRGAFCYHHQGFRFPAHCLLFTLIMGAESIPETLVSFHETTRRNIPQDFHPRVLFCFVNFCWFVKNIFRVICLLLRSSLHAAVLCMCCYTNQASRYVSSPCYMTKHPFMTPGFAHSTPGHQVVVSRSGSLNPCAVITTWKQKQEW